MNWLEKVRNVPMINSYEMIRWNLDKHYLQDLLDGGVRIPSTRFIETRDMRSLEAHVADTPWKEVILKPVVSGGARHTYRFLKEEAGSLERQYRKLVDQEAMMIQEFQESVLLKGEVSFLLMGGRFTHAVLKKAKDGDFRVQDDFGGTVHAYSPEPKEILFAEEVLASSRQSPTYARVDAIWDKKGNLIVSELELVEPELWFRFNPSAADRLAEAIVERYFNH
jgi:glutathione synthase/RimK-type ligase-like ATP-grasp enzyme